MGNGYYAGVLFGIPVVINVYGHRLKYIHLPQEIHDSVDMVMEIKNVHEIEVISSRDSSLHFLNRSILFCQKQRYF